MKRIYIISTVLLLLTSCSNSLTRAIRPQLTGKIKTDLNNLLPYGTWTVEIMDSIKQNPRQKELYKKYQESVQKNEDWFVKYVQTIPKGEPLPYHINFGLSEIEYKEMQEYLNNQEIFSSGTEEINIIKQGKHIRINSKGNLVMLIFLNIDFNKNKVLISMNDKNLTFKGTINITDETKGLKSKWKGYTWNSEEENNLDSYASKGLSNENTKQYSFTIGRLEKNGKTIIIIEGSIFKNGVKISGYETPIIF